LAEASPHLFICHSSKDQTAALEIIRFLEAEGLKCWISSRDILPSHNYQESIVTALESAYGIIFLFSEASSASGEIRKELSLAASENRPVFPLRLSPITPTGALRYELATRQWIDLFPDREQALGTLVRAVRRVLAAPAEAKIDAAAAPMASTDRSELPGRITADSRKSGSPLLASGSPEFEAIRALLARHIGPIAKIYVQKAAAEAQSGEELCQRLAAHVQTNADRAAFLKEARAQIAKRPLG
jgi:hypothetical protein